MDNLKILHVSDPFHVDDGRIYTSKTRINYAGRESAVDISKMVYQIRNLS